MNKQFLILLFLNLIVFPVSSQETVNKIYSEGANAIAQIDDAISLAANKNSHILVIIGGDWCKWCIRLETFIMQNAKIDSLIKADYVTIHINYSKENKNPEAMARLGFPQRFGFPVMVILNAKGERIHTQNTGYLEDRESYSEDKIIEFLKSWNRNAIDPSNYPN